MNDQPLMRFTSHIDGKNAIVSLYPDRIEWDRKSTLGTGAKLAVGAATFGASLLVTGVKGKHDGNMVLLRSVQGVTTKKGMLNTMVNVSAGASSVAFNCSHSEAEQFKTTVLRLLETPQTAPQVVVMQTPAASPTPQPPPVPAGAWHPDPSGAHEMRWWDGARWTEHVSDSGVTSVDPIR